MPSKPGFTLKHSDWNFQHLKLSASAIRVRYQPCRYQPSGIRASKNDHTLAMCGHYDARRPRCKIADTLSKCYKPKLTANKCAQFFVLYRSSSRSLEFESLRTAFVAKFSVPVLCKPLPTRLFMENSVHFRKWTRLYGQCPFASFRWDEWRCINQRILSWEHF